MELALSKEIKDALALLAYDELTPIQQDVIPPMLENQSVVVKAKTGSGKTAAYAIPLCENLDWDIMYPQTIILACTRELVKQIAQEVELIGKNKKIKVVSLIGKENMQYQIEEVKQRNHVIVATPGRFYDLLTQGVLTLDHVNHIVIDEADYMFSLGFYEQVDNILKELKNIAPEASISFFSATFPDKVDRMIHRYVTNPTYIECEDKADITHYYLQEEDKWAGMHRILAGENIDSAMIFTDTQIRCEEIYQRFIKDGMKVVRIHGGLQQRVREQNLETFKQGKARILIATDVAARGIDINKVSHIIHETLPDTLEGYIHRCGRCARNDASGVSIMINIDEKIGNQIKDEYDCIPYVNQPMIADYKNKLNSPQIKQGKKENADSAFTTLHINAGKTRKVRAGDIVGALCSLENITMEDIGVIKILHAMSYIEIKNEKAQIVLNNLKTIKNKNIKVAKAND